MEPNTPFKDVFNAALVQQMARDLKRVYYPFNSQAFESAIVPRLEPLSLTERSVLIAESLHKQLPQHYPDAIKIIVQSFGSEKPDGDSWGNEVFYHMPHGYFIHAYGLDYPDESVEAMLALTKRATAEFPIRHFIVKYPDKMLPLLHQWAASPNVHVRRLVSEGSRPRLPWGIRLKPFVADPKTVLGLLEQLKADPELYVRRSVANSLNDIAKDHPELVLETLKRWSKSKHPGTNWIIGHASRTLIKQGHPDALELLGYPYNAKVTISNFSLSARIPLNGTATFGFELTSREKMAVNLMIDYRLHFLTGSGKQSQKVFKLAKKQLQPGESIRLEKQHSFKPVSTRTYSTGEFGIEVIVNGRTVDEGRFWYG